MAPNVSDGCRDEARIAEYSNHHEDYFVDFALLVADYDFCFPGRNIIIALVPVTS